MKVCVFGAGATGSHFAVLLARAGADVSVVVRGPSVDAIRSSGITLHGDDGPLHAAVRATADVRELGPQDAVLVTLKAHALPAAAPAIGALLGPRTGVLFLQNGIPWWYYHGIGGEAEGRRLPFIDPADALWNAVGPERAIGGITSSACTLIAPGVVEVKGGNRPLTLGEPDGSASERLQALAELLRAAGFPVTLSRAIREAIWAKLALNLGSGPLSVLAPVPLRDMFAEPALVEARYRILAEVQAMASAMGCPLHIDIEAHMAFVRQSGHVPSIAQDAAAGRKPELEAMFHAPLRMAREHGVATPTLDLLVALCTLKARAAGLYP
jgi:2-dehydropantoate 2-reductase